MITSLAAAVFAVHQLDLTLVCLTARYAAAVLAVHELDLTGVYLTASYAAALLAADQNGLSAAGKQDMVHHVKMPGPRQSLRVEHFHCCLRLPDTVAAAELHFPAGLSDYDTAQQCCARRSQKAAA